jgi:hypothetical protein
MTPEQLMSQHMRVFKNAEPEHYEKFIRALDQYVTDVTVAVTEAPPTDILVAQGRAQFARKFMKICYELP